VMVDDTRYDSKQGWKGGDRPFVEMQDEKKSNLQRVCL
jgi:hypothetical protein